MSAPSTKDKNLKKKKNIFAFHLLITSNEKLVQKLIFCFVLSVININFFFFAFHHIFSFKSKATKKFCTNLSFNFSFVAKFAFIQNESTECRDYFRHIICSWRTISFFSIYFVTNAIVNESFEMSFTSNASNQIRFFWLDFLLFGLLLLTFSMEYFRFHLMFHCLDLPRFR